MPPPTHLLDELAAMPALLEAWAARFPGAAARNKPESGAFSFLENVWHLADLEREGYGKRILRLRNENDPALPDFEGDRIARERRYNELDLTEGLRNFADARHGNLQSLRALSPAEWSRAGNQDGVGRVRLEDVPSMMREHDLSHRREIEELLDGVGG
jgi:hypothetical protein